MNKRQHERAHQAALVAAFLFLLVVLAAVLTVPAQAERSVYPEFTCRGWIAAAAPMLRCEAEHVFPHKPQWRVWWGDEVADFDEGMVVWLTPPTSGRWARIEMSFPQPKGERVAVSVLGRWYDGKAQFQQYVAKNNPCEGSHEKPCVWGER